MQHASKRLPCRPRRGRKTQRLTFTLESDIATYLAEAWHAQRRPDGALYRTASEYVQDVLAADRTARTAS